MKTRLDLRGTLPLIVVLGVVTAFDAMAIDMYLPAFVEIGRSFAVDAASVQLSLSLFLGGLAAGQIIYGPLTDRFGRRPLLIAGILLFVAGSLVVAMAPTMPTFLGGRALQGFGGAGGLVISRAIVADLYDSREAAKVFSLLMQVMMIGPVAAPPSGGFLLGTLGWRSVFWTLTIIGTLSLVAVLKFVPESLPSEERDQPSIRAIAHTYAHLLGRKHFTLLVICGSFVSISLFSYLGSAAFIFVANFGLSPFTFSSIFAANAIGMVVVGQINIYLLNIWRADQILPFGLLIQLATSAALLLAVILRIESLLVIGLLIFLVVISMSLLFGNITSLVMSSATDHSASASSIYGTMQYMFSGAAGMILGALHIENLAVTPALMLSCSVGALIAWWGAARSSERAVKST